MWAPDDIADIDMSQWMKKSIAQLGHTDGRRIALDDYLYQDLHLIVGAIAARLHPEQWDEQARIVKPTAPETPGAGAMTTRNGRPPGVLSTPFRGLKGDFRASFSCPSGL